MVLIVRICHGGGIVALGEGLHEAVARACLERLVLVPQAHEVRLEVVIHPVLVVREAPLQLLERLDRERLVLQLVLVDHAHVVQPVGDDDVRGLQILRREGDLLQVILARLGVGRDGVLQRVGRVGGGDRVAVGVELRRVGQVAVGVVGGRGQRHGLVAATPIVLIDALAPLVLELGLALRHGLLVVEIEATIVPVEQWHLRRLYVLPLALKVVATALLVGQVTLLVGLFGLPFLFLLHLRDDLIDHRQPLLFGHAGQGLKAVLQVYRLDVHHQLVEHGREAGDAFVIPILPGHGRECAAEAGLRPDVILLREIDVAELDLADGQVEAVLHALLHALSVGGDGLRGVAPTHVDVADGHVDLVEVVLVFVALRHASEHAEHLLPT